jgi:hypothetical protein
MIRKRVPPEPPPSHVDRKVRPHNLKAGRSHLAVARPALRARLARPAGTTTRAVAEREARAPPIAEMDRTDGWLHRSESPSTQIRNRNHNQRKGSHVQYTHSITRPAGSETSALPASSRADRVHAP